MGFDRDREIQKPQDETLVQQSSELFKLSGKNPKVKKEGPYGGYYLERPDQHPEINID